MNKNKIAEKIVQHKLVVLIVFSVVFVLCFFLNKMVEVNFDLASYLPPGSPSTVSIEVMREEFRQSPPNARVMVENVTVVEALEFKDKIGKVEGVKEISWLDDAVNIYQPLEMIEQKTLDSWYKEDNALFTLLIDGENSIETVTEIKEIINGRGEIAGDIVDSVSAQINTGSEVKKMMFFIIPLIIIILLITTSSWFEPILFMLAIFVAIQINNGTNAFLGDISFISKTTSAILQLAVSMDYSIFLLHRFSEFRNEGQDVKTAMINAMAKSFPSIMASGFTTVIGFGALIVMRFGIGADLGIVLAKGVMFSMISILLLLPVLTVFTYKIIDKTKHRSFLPSFNKFGKFSLRIGLPVLCIVLLLVVPSFLAQGKNSFMYGASVMGNKSEGVSKMDELFGKANNIVVLVEKGNVEKEKELCDELKGLGYVSSLISYTESVGEVIPKSFIPKESLSALESDKYSRIVLTIATSQESDAAFDAVKELREICAKYYPDSYYLAGVTANVYDIKETVVSDNLLVTWIAIIGIGVVIMLTFKSISIPIALVLTIETSIWINLSFPYYFDEKMAYLGFMIISSIQLGATVDYAILFASRYLENRKLLPKKKAAVQTVSDTTASILTSASIMAVAGFIMSIVSSTDIIGQLGTLIGRGALLSAFLVLFFLPFVLVLLDGIIRKTTYKVGFYKGE